MVEKMTGYWEGARSELNVKLDNGPISSGERCRRMMRKWIQERSQRCMVDHKFKWEQAQGGQTVSEGCRQRGKS